ncbi:glutathione S-transferase C-terminal domain-containing protein homolog [Arctopsyche grandis]|uniref:glutathione S-transferase C-terminal domain-containing protein homolog n=1 Tax=Arctopsyche grandis TaxID=121162 RepID=UPI00406D879E
MELSVEVNERSSSEAEPRLLKCPVETAVMACVRSYVEMQTSAPTTTTTRLETHPAGNGRLWMRLPDALESDVSDYVECRLPAVRQSSASSSASANPTGDSQVQVRIRVQHLSGGLSAAARRLAKASAAVFESPPHHPQGLLGFRGSCLHAPNETSVWTKFCEVEMVETTELLVRNLLSHSAHFGQILAERHLTQPLRIHNVYKFARRMQHNQAALDQRGDASQPVAEASRIGKNRKWKSKKAVLIESSTPLKDLGLDHEFAEGPHLTLADVLLYPCFYLIFHILNLDRLSAHLPETVRWFRNLRSRPRFEKLDDFLSDVCRLTFKDEFIISDSVEYLMPDVENCSLYKCDPSRDRSKKRVFTKDVETALGFIKQGLEIDLCKTKRQSKIDWSSVPDAANPFGGHLPADRVERKTQQLENLATAVLNIAKDGNRIVDFCSGGGHLGILLAYLLPSCQIVLLENKEQSLSRAQVRVEALSLTNVTFVQCNLDFFTGPFDIGVALHACGVSTDLVLDKCIERKATFVVCPCCYGSLHTTDRLQYPRSAVFSDVPIDSYMCIGHSADQTHVNHPMEERGVRCMTIIDSDRAQHAMSNGYSVVLSQLEPKNCTPKNMLLVGVRV